MLLAALLILSACRTEQETNSTGATAATVVATVEPIRLIVAELLGPDQDIPVLLPPGVSPHAYDPLPSAVRAASGADIILAINPDVDGWVVRLGAGSVWWLTPEGQDPHSWLDPLHVRDQLPRIIAALCEKLPANCDAIQDRGTDFSRELEAMVPEGVERLSGTRIVPSGIFLSAFAARFQLDAATPIAPTEGVEPSPRDVARSIDAARDAGLVVGQVGFPELAAREVAQASGARYVEVDPIGSTNPVEGYAGLIAQIIGGISI